MLGSKSHLNPIITMKFPVFPSLAQPEAATSPKIPCFTLSPFITVLLCEAWPYFAAHL